METDGREGPKTHVACELAEVLQQAHAGLSSEQTNMFTQILLVCEKVVLSLFAAMDMHRRRPPVSPDIPAQPVGTVPQILRLPTATAHAVRRGLGFDAPAVVSRDFRCVSMLPLWFRANSVAFRCSHCGFARIPASRGLFRPLLGWPLRLPTATARAVGRGLGSDARAVVSREFRCVSMLPLWFRANSVASKGFDTPAVVLRVLADARLQAELRPQPSLTACAIILRMPPPPPRPRRRRRGRSSTLPAAPPSRARGQGGIIALGRP